MREHGRETHERMRDGELTVPTLHVFGRNDLTVPVEMAMGAVDLLVRRTTRCGCRRSTTAVT